MGNVLTVFRLNSLIFIINDEVNHKEQAMKRFLKEEIECNNDKVNAMTKEGDEVYCSFEDSDAHPFLWISNQNGMWFDVGETQTTHYYLLGEYIMLNYIAPYLEQLTDDEWSVLNEVQDGIESEVYEVDAEDREDTDWQTKLQYYLDQLYYSASYVLDNVEEYAENGEGELFRVTYEALATIIARNYGFDYDKDEQKFTCDYLSTDNPSIQDMMNNLGIAMEDVYDDAVAYGRIWTYDKVIGLTNSIEDNDLSMLVDMLSNSLDISVDELMEYHIGWYDLPYLVTIRDFLNGDYGGYDDEDEYDDDEEENVSGNERRMPVIHNMNAKDKRETDQIRAYLDTKNKKYGDIEARMRKMGKPDAMAYYNSLKTQESVEKPKRTIVISETQMKKLFNIN